MTILLIYVAIFAIAFLAVRLVQSHLTEVHDFTSLKTVTFGDESAVTANRAASVISVIAIFLIWGAFTGSKWSPIHAPGPFIGEASIVPPDLPPPLALNPEARVLALPEGSALRRRDGELSLIGKADALLFSSEEPKTIERGSDVSWLLGQAGEA